MQLTTGYRKTQPYGLWPCGLMALGSQCTWGQGTGQPSIESINRHMQTSNIHDTIVNACN